jgi:hypothetical protein
MGPWEFLETWRAGCAREGYKTKKDECIELGKGRTHESKKETVGGSYSICPESKEGKGTKSGLTQRSAVFIARDIAAAVSTAQSACLNEKKSKGRSENARKTVQISE